VADVDLNIINANIKCIWMEEKSTILKTVIDS